MKNFKRFATVIAALCAFGGSVLPALAVTNEGTPNGTSYVTAFAPVFGPSVPHTGVMQLVVGDGTISGTYTGTSVSPDSLDNRIVLVTGTISSTDRYVQLSIGGALSLHGTLNADGTISGTAMYDGRLYEFVAAPGRLAS